MNLKKRIVHQILCIASYVVIGAVFCSFMAGCCDTLRFAPSESQKQTAELTHDIAIKVNTEGASPQSPASQRLVKGTRAAAVYMGRTATPPDMEEFDTIVTQAERDAPNRPNPWSMVIDLGIAIASLSGGAGGFKVVRFLQAAKKKAVALDEIVMGNEMFKTGLSKENQEVLDMFKRTHENMQTASTAQLVATIKKG